MKVAVVHSFYGSAAPSGENLVVEAEIALLREHGHEVVTFFRHSDEIRARGALGLIEGALATPWNPLARARLRRFLRAERPDVMHVHNTFPLLSPSIFSAASGLDVALVLSLHNFRLFCANGLAMRAGAPCTRCLDAESSMPAIRHRCYRGSRTATLPVAAMIGLNRALGTWARHVDAFVALSRFQRDLMVRYGLPADRLVVKPNFYATDAMPLPWDRRDDRVAFIGRLSQEKGARVLVEAWCRMGHAAPGLDVVGDGPEREALERLAQASSNRPPIRFLGVRPFEETQAILRRARALVVPSLCFEGFPMVVREAYAFGVPVIASRIGSLGDIVTDGVTGQHFTPGNADELATIVLTLWRTHGMLERMASAAREAFDESLTASTGHARLIAIYQAAIARRHQRLGLPAVSVDPSSAVPGYRGPTLR